MDDPGPEAFPEIAWCDDEDRAVAIAKMLAKRPPHDDVWVFAYGSLIWNPAFDFLEQRIAVARGWHRSFCLGWITRFRGSKDRPGLMMALDRGGQCTGVAYRLPRNAIEPNLLGLFRREMLVIPDPLRPVWLNVRTDGGVVPAITFVINRKGGMYVPGLTPDRVADTLVVAAGHVGSMADYLYNTVRHLEDLGIRDEHLWTLQELVAERLECLR
jgi:cation transport protein ChaC